MKSFRKSNTAVQTSLVVKSFILLVVSLLAISCSNMLGSQGESSSARGCETGSVSFTGTISVSGALPAALSHADESCHAELDSASQSSASRSALPSFTIGNEYYYYVTATQANGSDSVNKNSLSTPNPFTTTNGVTFALPLTNGNWNIEAGIKKANVSGIARADDVSVMSETYPVTISTANPVVSHTFYPKPSQEGSGNVALNISYDSGKVDSVTAKCGNESWTVSTSGTPATIQMDSIASGTYDLSIYFYKNDGNGNSILVYSTVQTINVFDNMTTNTWVSDGSSLINASGVFNLNSTLITQFTRTTFYVGSTSVGAASDDTGSGSPYTPFKTINKAMEVIAANGDSSKDYRIFVSGTVPGAQTINASANNASAKSLTIQGLNGLDENGNPKDTIDGSLEGSPNTDNTLYLFTQYPVFIKNLTITSNSEKNGIFYQTNSDDKKTLTLESGTYITGNKNGANIQNAKVVIKSGVLISQNKRGVYASAGGELVIKEGALITLNKGEGNGAGILVESGSSLEVQGGEISYNEASGNGGGINSSYCSFTMTGGLVKGNKARIGGGIYTKNDGNSIS